jgi:hypothetical protein
MIQKITAYSKAIVGLIGVVLTGLNYALPIIPNDDKHYVTAIIGVLTLVTATYAKYAPTGKSARLRSNQTAKRHTTVEHPAPSREKPQT